MICVLGLCLFHDHWLFTIVAGGLSFAPCNWVPYTSIPFAQYLASIGICIGDLVAVVRKDGMISDSSWKQLPLDATYWANMFQLPVPNAIKVSLFIC